MDTAVETDVLIPSLLTSRKNPVIAAIAIVGIFSHLALRYGIRPQSLPWMDLELQTLPLLLTLLLGGLPQVVELSTKLFRREFGSDLLAGISIVTSVILGEYLAGALVVLMLSGGQTLEAYAVRSASSVLNGAGQPHAFGRPSPCRWPTRRRAAGRSRRRRLLLVFPHEICPVDGTVVEGHGVMDESYLTGEPYRMSKAPGSAVLSGAINGEAALHDSGRQAAGRFALRRIMQVMRASEQRRPRLRRLADQLGAYLHAAGRGDRCGGLASERRPARGSWPCWSSPRRARC